MITSASPHLTVLEATKLEWGGIDVEVSGDATALRDVRNAIYERWKLRGDYVPLFKACRVHTRLYGEFNTHALRKILPEQLLPDLSRRLRVLARCGAITSVRSHWYVATS